MPGYLSETAFVGKLFFDIIMWIVILLITFYCIRRNPTDYDTNYRKRNRMIFGSLCFLAAMGFLFWGFMLPEDFAIRNYFLSTFGTYAPNKTMIQLGMSPTVSPRAVGVTPVFALPTYEQWLILQKINSFAVTLALGIICFFFKKSSTRTLAKVRKVCGYIFLIFLVPAALNIHLYFDLEEFIVTIPICIITWLLLRTYRKDFVEPTLPVESVQHGDNKDFKPINPEEKVEEQNHISLSHSIKNRFAKFQKTKAYYVYWSLAILLFILTYIIAILGINRVLHPTDLTMDYYICAIIICVFATIGLTTYVKQLRREGKVMNIKAMKLFNYTIISLLIEYFIILFIFLFHIPLIGHEYIDILVVQASFTGYLILVRVPLAIHISKRISKKEDTYWLVPMWLRTLIKNYSETEAPLRTCTAFVIYPFFYLCTFPGGAAFLGYLIPAIIIFTITLFTQWAVNGKRIKNYTS